MTNIKINKICKKILLITVVGFCLFFQKVNAQVQLLNTFDLTNNGLVPNTGGTQSGRILSDYGTWIAPNAALITSNVTSGAGITLGGTTTGAVLQPFSVGITTNGVTNSLFRQSAANTLVGNPTGLTANVMDITLGSGLSFSGNTLIATGSGGTVTSIGLVMPSGFSVSTPNPITGSGTFTVTGAGTTSQYIKGDGSLGTYALSTLTDATITTPSAGQILQYSSGKWINITPTYLTGNQTINLTGDVTGNGATSIATTISNNAVTYAKMQLETKSTLLGNPSATTSAVPSEITLGAGLAFSGTSLLTSNIPNSSLANSSITINGTNVSLGNSISVTAANPYSLTFNNGGSGAASGATYNGSVAQTVSYNTIGAQAQLNGTGYVKQSGTTTSYVSQIPLTTDVTGILPLANGGTNNALTANNGGIVYSDASKLQILAPSTTAGYLLQSNGAAAPSWVSPSSVVGNTAWLLGGNSNVTTSSYLGSASGNDVPLVFEVNGVQSGYLGDANSSAALATSFGVGTAALYKGTMIGNGATANGGGTENVSVGYQASSAYQSVAIGELSTASGGGNTVAVGYKATASGYEGTALGSGATATGNNSTAIGYGASTSQANALVLGNNSVSVGIGTSTPGYKLDVAGDINFTGALRVAGNAGTSGQILTSTGTAASWQSPSSLFVTSFSTTLSGLTPSTASTGAVTLAGTLGVASGGTGLTAATQGGILYGTSTSAVAYTPAGTSGYLLQSNGTGAPTWVNPSSLSVSNIYTADGTLAGARNVYMNSNILKFNTGTTASPGNGVLYIDPTKNFVGIGVTTAGPPSSTTGATDTLSVQGTVNAVNYTSAVQALTDAAPIVWDLSKGASAKVSIGTASRTLNIQNIKPGMYGVLVVTNAVGSATAIGTVQINGTAITDRVINAGNSTLYFTPVANAVDILSFFYDGANLWWTIGNNYN